MSIGEFFSRAFTDENGVRQVRLIRPWEELLASGCTWYDLCVLFEDVEVVWLSEDVYIYGREDDNRSPLWNSTEHVYYFQVSVSEDFTNPPEVYVCLCSLTTHEPADDVCEQLFQLMEKEPASQVSWHPGRPHEDDDGDEDDEVVDFSATVETLASVLELSRCHERFVFFSSAFSQEHCRVLASFRGSLDFFECSFEDDGRGIFEAIGSNQGATELSIYGDIVDASLLHDAVRNTTSLRKLTLLNTPGIFPLQSFAQNRGLVELIVDVHDESQWTDLIRSVRRHPTLEKLRVARYVYPREDSVQEQLARSRFVLDMLQENKTINDLGVYPRLDEQNFAQQIRPQLKTNLYRPRIKKLVEESNLNVQRRLFSHALTQPEVNESPSLMFMLLSSFDDVLSESYVRKEETASVSATAPGHRRKRRRVRR